MEEQAKTIAELLKLLANEHRLLILCALIKGQLTVGDIHKCVPNITASALSQHLNQLKTAGILSSEKQGMNVIYQIQDERVIALMGVMKNYIVTNRHPRIVRYICNINRINIVTTYSNKDTLSPYLQNIKKQAPYEYLHKQRIRKKLCNKLHSLYFYKVYHFFVAHFYEYRIW